MMKSSVIVVLFLCFGSINSNFINDKPCGVVVSDNPIHQHPWLVLIEYYLNGRRALAQCGGSLITSRHILTSAHCLKIVKSIPGWQPTVTILPKLGEYNRSSRRDCVAGVCSDPVIRMVVDIIIVHPGFYRDRVSHDLAILVLETEAPYTDFIRPICLPTTTSEIPTELYASGFGNTPNSDHPSKIKKILRLPYYPRCPIAYERIFNLPKDGFCAGGKENVDTCNGDSGGPIIWVREDGDQRRAELWGVIKGGTKRCGLKGKPGVYTSVPQNLFWIRNVIEMTTLKEENYETKKEEKENGGNENGENQNGNDQNGEKQDHGKPNKNQNDEKPDKGKHSEDNNSGERRPGSSYLVTFMLIFCSFWL